MPFPQFRWLDGRPCKRLDRLHADKSCDWRRCRRDLRRLGMAVGIARIDTESKERLGRHREIVERTHLALQVSIVCTFGSMRRFETKYIIYSNTNIMNMLSAKIANLIRLAESDTKRSGEEVCRTPDALEIEGICMRLFDTWCEQRSVLPLAYLMHAWPLVEHTENSLKRLSQSLGELILFHSKIISRIDRELILRVIYILKVHESGCA